MLDDLVKYGSINNNLDLYYNNYKIDYNVKNLVNSQSNGNTYSHCYGNYILKFSISLRINK